MAQMIAKICQRFLAKGNRMYVIIPVVDCKLQRQPRFVKGNNYITECSCSKMGQMKVNLKLHDRDILFF